jgi:O-6-methylguanine DNA methyltransferase
LAQRVRGDARYCTGTNISYGEIAKRTGAPRETRETCKALVDNLFPVIVPCRRVVAVDARMLGRFGADSVRTKLRLLEVEGDEGVVGPALVG